MAARGDPRAHRPLRGSRASLRIRALGGTLAPGRVDVARARGPLRTPESGAFVGAARPPRRGAPAPRCAGSELAGTGRDRRAASGRSPRRRDQPAAVNRAVIPTAVRRTAGVHRARADSFWWTTTRVATSITTPRCAATRNLPDPSP